MFATSLGRAMAQIFGIIQLLMLPFCESYRAIRGNPLNQTITDLSSSYSSTHALAVSIIE